MKIYRATAPTGLEMQNDELVEFIGSLNLPYESCVASDCGVGETEYLFRKGNGMATYFGGECIRIPGYRQVYVEIGRLEPLRIVYLDDSQTRCIRIYLNAAYIPPSLALDGSLWYNICMEYKSNS